MKTTLNMGFGKIAHCVLGGGGGILTITILGCCVSFGGGLGYSSATLT